jgi:hypothetical protein
MLLASVPVLNAALDKIELGLDRLAVSIGFHTPRSIAKRNASHRH